MTTWKSVPLGELAELQAGVGFPPSMQGRLEGELPLAKVGDISRAVRAGGSGLIAPLHHISRTEAAQLRARIFPPGSTVFAKIGEAISQNFRLLTDREAAFDNNVMGAIPRPGVEPRYLFRFLQTIDLYAYASKTTVPALRKSDLELISVPLPAAAEQRHIADILDRADAIRRKRKEAIALTVELLRSTFLDMFGDPVTNPKAWPVKTMDELDVKFSYGTSTKCSDDDTGHAVLRIPNVVSGDISYQDVKYAKLDEAEVIQLALRNGDILFVRTNGNPNYIARCAVFNGSELMCFASYLIRARLSAACPVLPRFVHAVFSSESFRAQLLKEATTTAGNYNINTTGLGRQRIPLPPMATQEKFVEVVNKVKSVRVTQGRHSQQSDCLFDCLVSRAFSGDRR